MHGRDLFEFFLFFVSPIFMFIFAITWPLSIRDNIRKAGINYFTQPEENNPKFFLFLKIGFIITFIINIMFFVLKEWGSLIFGLGGMSIYFSMMIIFKYLRIAPGIYENGIVDSGKNLTIWSKIHSYCVIENGIYGYLHTGEYFEYKNIVNIDEIENLFKRNRVNRREKI